MDDIVREAASCFNINLHGYSKSRAVFLLNTDKGAMILKRQADVKRIDDLYRITEALRDAGFLNTERYLSCGGKPYAAIGDGFYTVSTCGSGEKCCLSDSGSVLAIAGTIAGLHSSGLKINARGIATSELVSERYYAKRIAEAKHNKKWLNKQSRLTDIDVLFIKKYDEYLNRAYKAAEKICESERESELSLCFGEVKEDNVFIDDENNVTLLNFENSVLSAPVTDLCQLIRRFMKRGGNGALVPQIISAYSEMRKLSPKDIEFIKAFLSFPHKFFALTGKYYNGKKVYGGTHTLTRLKADVAHQEKLFAILKMI